MAQYAKYISIMPFNVILKPFNVIFENIAYVQRYNSKPSLIFVNRIEWYYKL